MTPSLFILYIITAVILAMSLGLARKIMSGRAAMLKVPPIIAGAAVTAVAIAQAALPGTGPLQEIILHLPLYMIPASAIVGAAIILKSSSLNSGILSASTVVVSCLIGLAVGIDRVFEALILTIASLAVIFFVRCTESPEITTPR